MDYANLNGVALAYVGDAVYEVYIRDYLINKGQTRPNNLHKLATCYVSAKAQAHLLKKILESNLLTSEEEQIYLRGRNAKTYTKAKNTDWSTYSYSTGFEALIGFLHLTEQKKRLEELVNWCIKEVGEVSVKKWQ